MNKWSEYELSEGFDANWFPQNKELLELIKGHGFIAGGAAMHMLAGDYAYGFRENITSDIDVFCYSQADVNAIQKLLVSNSYICSQMTKFATSFYHKNNNNWSLESKDKEHPYVAVQIIHSVFGKPIDILDTFDFTVCQFAVELTKNGKLYGFNGAASVQDRNSRRLRLYKVAPDFRVQWARTIKYLGKGFRLSNSDLVMLFNKWASMTPEEKEAFEKPIMVDGVPTSPDAVYMLSSDEISPSIKSYAEKMSKIKKEMNKIKWDNAMNWPKFEAITSSGVSGYQTEPGYSTPTVTVSSPDAGLYKVESLGWMDDEGEEFN